MRAKPVTRDQFKDWRVEGQLASDSSTWGFKRLRASINVIDGVQVLFRVSHQLKGETIVHRETTDFDQALTWYNGVYV